MSELRLEVRDGSLNSARKPSAVSNRHIVVSLAVPDHDRTSDASRLEAPRSHECQIVVTPASNAVRDPAPNGPSHELTECRDVCRVRPRKRLCVEGLSLHCGQLSGFRLEVFGESVSAGESQRELVAVILVHAREPL